MLELGWDDLLRFQCVRGLLTTVAWAPGAALLFVDWMVSASLSRADGTTFWPVYVAIAFGILLYLVFRRGRHLWRRAWETRAPDVRIPG